MGEKRKKEEEKRKCTGKKGKREGKKMEKAKKKAYFNQSINLNIYSCTYYYYIAFEALNNILPPVSECLAVEPVAPGKKK